MKNNRRTFIAIIGILIVAIIFTMYYFTSNTCDPDGTNLCYDQVEGQYKIETGAYLSVQVESEDQGKYLVETWNMLHPENKDAIVYLVKAPLSAAKLKEGLTQDISITSLDAASYFLEDFYDAKGLDGVVGSKIPNQLENMINYNGYYFTPNSINGPVFVYNETLMQELSFDTLDSNNNGLPDSFETWEKIFEAQDEILTKLPIVFPLTFKDQNSFYPFLTSGHWRLFMSKDSMNPGYNSREFLEGLDLITAFSEVVLDKNTATEVVIEEVTKEEDEVSTENTKEEDVNPSETTKEEVANEENPDNTTDSQQEIIENEVIEVTYENTAESLKWQYETSFYDRKTMFTLLDPNTTQFKDYASKTEDNYKVSIMPTFKEGNLSPLANVYGYVINKDIKFPSASAEVIRILRSPESISLYDVSSGNYPIYSSKFLGELTIDDPKTLEYIRAYNYHDTASVMALKGNPQILAKSIYKEVDIMQPLMELFNDNITKEEAQNEIVELTEIWYSAKEVVE